MVKCLQICLSNMLFWDIWNTSQIFEHAFMNFQKQIYFVSTCMKYVYMQKKPRPLWIKFASTCPLLISRILASSTPSEGLSFHFWPLLVSSLSLFHFWPLPWCHHFHLSTFGHSPGVITFTFFTFGNSPGVITFTFFSLLVSSLSLVHCYFSLLLSLSLLLFHFWPLPWCHHFHLSTVPSQGRISVTHPGAENIDNAPPLVVLIVNEIEHTWYFYLFCKFWGKEIVCQKERKFAIKINSLKDVWHHWLWWLWQMSMGIV